MVTVMTFVTVECLQCGGLRQVERAPEHGVDRDRCARCDYVGWAPTAELTEAERRELRELPVELRGVAAGRHSLALRMAS